MTVGVWLNNDMLPQEGGAYTYIHSLVKLLDTEKFKDANIVFITYKKQGEQSGLNKPIIYLNEHYTFFTYLLKLLRRVFKFNEALSRALTAAIDRASAAIVRKRGVDIIYYLNQVQREIGTIPFVATNWDIAHLSLGNFPEFIENGQLEKRQKWYGGEFKKATAIVVESEAGKEELMKYLQLSNDKIFVVPFFIDHIASHGGTGFIEKLGLQPGRYIYYPAQFWKHKNHINLVRAFGLFAETGPRDIKLIFTGSDKGEWPAIKKEIDSLKLNSRVICAGFVSEAEKTELIACSLCVAMPSLLGPTNLPPLEALGLNVPSINSNLKGHMELTGKAALYFDPRSVKDMSDKITAISDEKIRAELINNIETAKRESKFNAAGAKSALEKLFTYLKDQGKA